MAQAAYDIHTAYQQAKQAAHSSDTTQSWETLLETLTEHDGSTVDAWKDELNNLLIFAGLFSAVVTAFTVESYTWLQPDPAQTSAQLLAQISLQLSSLTVTAGHINSSAPSLSLAAAQTTLAATFVPGPGAVPINVLWVLSLTLSLLAALFAIAVQQWLRHLPLPPALALREKVRLQQARHEGLRIWQVASIVALLPLVLQAAVVLFLAGLLLLLAPLNRTVAHAFAAAAGTGLALFLAAALIPLVSVRCPYKSPLVPTVATVLQWATYPPTLVLCAAATAVDAVCRTQPIERWMFRHRCWVAYRNSVHWRVEQLQTYLRAFGAHMYIDVNAFWTAREQAALVAQDGAALDCGALARGLVSASCAAYERMRACMHDLADAPRVACVRDTVLGALGCTEDDVAALVLGRAGPPELTAAHCARTLSPRHADLLVAAFPRAPALAQLDAFCTHHDIAHLLVVLRGVLRAHPSASPRRMFYRSLLLHLRVHQRLDRESWWWTGKQVVTALLYEECAQHPFSHEDTRLAVSWALELLALANRPDAEWVLKYAWLHTADTVLAGTATALAAADGDTADLDAETALQLARLLRSLTHFVHKYRDTIAACADPWGAAAASGPEASVLAVGPGAVAAICRHLATLARRLPLPMRGGRDVYAEAEGALSALCTGRAGAAFVDARRGLRRLRAALSDSHSRDSDSGSDLQEQGRARSERDACGSRG